MPLIAVLSCLQIGTSVQNTGLDTNGRRQPDFKMVVTDIRGFHLRNITAWSDRKVQTSHLPLHPLQGGSYGRETVLRGCSDGILVLFVDQFHTFQEQKENQSELLSLIEQWLKTHEKYKPAKFGGILVVLLSTQGQRIRLQLLPAFDPLCECYGDWGWE